MGLVNTLLWALGIAAAIWVIYDVWTQQRRMGTGEKIFWTVVAIIFSIITAIIYYLVKKR